MNPQSKSAKYFRIIAIAAAITFVIALINLIGSTNKVVWGVVAGVSAVLALGLSRSFEALQRKEY